MRIEIGIPRRCCSAPCFGRGIIGDPAGGGFDIIVIARCPFGQTREVSADKAGFAEIVDAIRNAALGPDVRGKRPEARLIIAGTGRDRDLRVAIIRTGQQDAVQMPGYVEDPIGIMLRCDAFVSASRWEAFGRSMVEAMACRLPVIGHASGGTPEIVEHGVTGLLYKNDEHDLSAAMLKLMDDRDAARAMGEKGHAAARDRFTVESSAQAFKRSLDHALQQA